MSQSAALQSINELLAPVLFQVIGSTPESIADSIIDAKLGNQSVIGMKLAALSIFASAVNKATMEQFASTPPMADIRPTLSSNFSVGGKTNMTGLTLLGHCVLTSNLMDDIKFASEFRRKMGQNHLWAGDFANGSLSDKQKKILEEKKRLTNENSARLLGSGFFKFIGVDKNAYTAQEAHFWKIPDNTRISPSPPRSPPRPRPETLTGFVTVRMPDGTDVNVDKEAYDYYLAVNDNEISYLIKSIGSKGIDKFNQQYKAANKADPNRKGKSGNTVVG